MRQTNGHLACAFTSIKSFFLDPDIVKAQINAKDDITVYNTLKITIKLFKREHSEMRPIHTSVFNRGRCH